MPTAGYIEDLSQFGGSKTPKAKGDCGCGCKGAKKKWYASVASSPEFILRLNSEVDKLMQRAREIKSGGKQQRTFEVLPLGRKFDPPKTIPVSVHLARLQSSVRLQQTQYFNPESGSFPTAIDWTSTVLATHLVNYAQQTGDHRYFSHLVAFFHNQNVTGLIRQNYDDQLWVVLTFLRGAAYAAEHEPEWVDPFLERASVFYDLASAGWDARTCGGGMVWGRWARYKNAVTTELYIAASIGMYESLGDDRMLENASRGWVWLKRSGMLNKEGLFNDGLDNECRNNRQMTWTYNQGIILSGLSGLYKFTGDEQLIIDAQNLIDSVLESYLVPTTSGILVESCDPFRTCDQDQWMFKGIFFQHLGYFLQDLTELGELDVTTKQQIREKYHGFIQTNACAVWDIARQKDGKIGNWWDGPPNEEIQRQVSVETHGSGVAAILCAVRVGQLLESSALKHDDDGVKDIKRAIRGLGLCGEKWNDNL